MSMEQSGAPDRAFEVRPGDYEAAVLHRGVLELNRSGRHLSRVPISLRLTGRSSKTLGPLTLVEAPVWLGAHVRCGSVASFDCGGFSRIDGLHVARAEAGEVVYAGRVENGVPRDMVRLRSCCGRAAEEGADRGRAQAQDAMGTPQVLVEIDFPAPSRAAGCDISSTRVRRYAETGSGSEQRVPSPRSYECQTDKASAKKFGVRRLARF